MARSRSFAQRRFPRLDSARCRALPEVANDPQPTMAERVRGRRHPRANSTSSSTIPPARTAWLSCIEACAISRPAPKARGYEGTGDITLMTPLRLRRRSLVYLMPPRRRGSTQRATRSRRTSASAASNLRPPASELRARGGAGSNGRQGRVRGRHHASHGATPFSHASRQALRRLLEAGMMTVNHRGDHRHPMSLSLANASRYSRRYQPADERDRGDRFAVYADLAWPAPRAERHAGAGRRYSALLPSPVGCRWTRSRVDVTDAARLGKAGSQVARRATVWRSTPTRLANAAGPIGC